MDVIPGEKFRSAGLGPRPFSGHAAAQTSNSCYRPDDTDQPQRPGNGNPLQAFSRDHQGGLRPLWLRPGRCGGQLGGDRGRAILPPSPPRSGSNGRAALARRPRSRAERWSSAPHPAARSNYNMKRPASSRESTAFLAMAPSPAIKVMQAQALPQGRPDSLRRCQKNPFANKSLPPWRTAPSRPPWSASGGVSRRRPGVLHKRK